MDLEQVYIRGKGLTANLIAQIIHSWHPSKLHIMRTGPQTCDAETMKLVRTRAPAVQFIDEYGKTVEIDLCGKKK